MNSCLLNCAFSPQWTLVCRPSWTKLWEEGTRLSGRPIGWRRRSSPATRILTPPTTSRCCSAESVCGWACSEGWPLTCLVFAERPVVSGNNGHRDGRRSATCVPTHSHMGDLMMFRDVDCVGGTHLPPHLLLPTALCDMHPMRALFLIPRNPAPRLKSKKW